MTPGAKPPAVATARAVVRLKPCVARVTTAALRIFSRVCERPDPLLVAISASRRQRAAVRQPYVYLNIRSEHMFILGCPHHLSTGKRSDRDWQSPSARFLCRRRTRRTAARGGRDLRGSQGHAH